MKKLAIPALALLALAPAANAATLKTSCANVNSTSPKKAEKAEICLVNEERVRFGLQKLTTSSKLNSLARAHSRDMHKNRYFDHTDQQGRDPFDRMKAAGYRFQAAGENIFFGPDTAADLVSGWMASKGHCTNILGYQFTEIGMGIASGDGRTLSTQEFGTPQGAQTPPKSVKGANGCPYKNRRYAAGR